MAMTLDELLRRAVESHASDIHLKVGSPPVIRVDGELKRMEDLPSLRPKDTEAIAQSIFTPRAEETFNATNEVDFAIGRQDLGRFRVNAYRQRGSVSVVMRRVVPGVPTLERLGLPPIVRKLTTESKGLVLITGPSGSGRTTSLAAMVEHINASRPVSIVTIEDPIEVLFPDKVGVVTQREVGVDTVSYSEAIRRAMRQDADVIMLSEIVDGETAQAAIGAAETGHLVLAAMHTADPADTIERFVNFYPTSLQSTARSQLGAYLKAIISQRLIDSTNGGRVMAAEVLTGNNRIAELVNAGAKADAFVEMMRESEFFGMQTFDQAVLNLVKEQRVAVPTALPFVRNSHEFRAKAMEAGIEV
ncbi:MAG: PilT/PilU family type 4a pilus ATPase [Acidimicrobiia bacterium]|nr:PilT/PilU family type 4a pilus ATPase [Acidimicrobiia bacterium]MDH5293408.1 PilT/PilU family type 4a pilus ATPase [Acidimicrobiia bacterium]